MHAMVLPNIRQIHLIPVTRYQIPDTPEFTFQCDSKLELDKHIKINHNKKTQLQCSVCMICLSNLDDLAKHMTDTHKNEFSCRNCEMSYNRKEELDKHIFEEHIS